MKMGRDLGRILPLLLLMTAFVGCGGDGTMEKFQQANKVNMQKIANAYRMFASINKDVGPEDEEEFKTFLRTDERIAPRLGLSSLDLENLDDYFTSEVDGQPFVVLYGQRIDPTLDYSAIVFDQEGVGGKRRIALACSEIIEVTDDKDYDRILGGGIKRKDVPAHVFGGGIDAATEENAE